jgi:putative photosynthetic complex assembly protein
MHSMAIPSKSSFFRSPIAGASLLVVLAIAGTAVVRLTGSGIEKAPITAAAVMHELRFEDGADGSILIYEAKHNKLIDRAAPGQNNFLRGTLRGLARERKRIGVDSKPPFRLVSRADGRLMLEDPSTGRYVDLGSFGNTNRETFVRLLAIADAAS